MGFYGNITYNTYGLQEKGVKPEHLDRSYWRTIPAYEVIGQTGLRTLLQLDKVTVNQKDVWDVQWAEAEKTCFKFYFPNVTENITLRKLYGNGYLLGWVRKNTLDMTDWTSSSNWTLYMVALNGERAGQMFYYPISPINTEIELSTEDADSTIDEEEKLSNWLNDYLEGPIITTPLIRNQSITTDKIVDNAVTTDKIDNYQVTTIKIADDAITTDKIDDYQVTTIKIADDAVTGGEGGKIKQATITAFNIASYTIAGGVEGNIAEKTITDYNIAPYTITGEANKEHCNIAEKTITNFNIADNTITKDQLKDTYARCHYGQGYPTSTITIGLIDKNELDIGDLYIDLNTGFIYIYKGYNFYQEKYDWISYLSGGRGNNRPKTGNIGDIWVDSNTGKVYIYQENKASSGTYGWSPIQTYQDTHDSGENMDETNSIQLHYISNEQSLENETGLYSNIKNLLQATSTVSSGIFIFTGDGGLGEDSDIDRIVFNNYDSNTVFVGAISSSEGGRYSYYNMTCFCTTTGELFKLSLYDHDHTGLSIAISPIIGPSVILDSAKLYTTTVNGTLAFNSEQNSLSIYIDGQWVDIKGYAA